MGLSEFPGSFAVGKRENQEDLLVVSLSCLLAILGVMLMRMYLKLDFQAWSAVYILAAGTAAVRWTSAGSNVSIGSGFRALFCLLIGLIVNRLSGYPSVVSFQTASLLPNEVVDALAHFHIFYDR